MTKENVNREHCSHELRCVTCKKYSTKSNHRTGDDMHYCDGERMPDNMPRCTELKGCASHSDTRAHPAAPASPDVLELLKKKIKWGKEIDKNHLFDYHAIGGLIKEAEERIEQHLQQQSKEH